MPATAVVDFQWGDGGKGKIVSYLSDNIDLGVRGNGGRNSGHVTNVEGKEVVLHLIPSCVVRGKKAAIGRGCVVYPKGPKGLLEEINGLKAAGINNLDLMIDGRAHVTTEDHIREDGGNAKIGTTGMGIGPTYTSKYARKGIRMIDYAEEHPEFKPMIRDVSLEVNTCLDTGENVLLEGAQGFGLCVDNGTYPFVTSSNTTVTGLCAGVGMSERRVYKTIGVVKSYPTRVGKGPMPTQLGTDSQIENEIPELLVTDLERVAEGDEYSIGKFLRIKGHEYGATTGRKRKPGWFDSVVVRSAALVNHPNEISLTKLDVLSGLKELNICSAYETENGRTMSYLPADTNILWRCKPVYQVMGGWNEDITGVRSFDKLPQDAQNYVNRIQDLLNVPITMIGVGPERSQIILRKP